MKLNRLLFAVILSSLAVALQFVPQANAAFANYGTSRSNVRYVPNFHLPSAIKGRRGISSITFFDGRMRVLHFFGSWCVSCRGEQAYLATLARTGTPLIGIAVRDNAVDVEEFLRRYGNPFASIGDDRKNLLQKAMGSNGVPETLIISGHGEIIYRHVGELSDADVPIFLSIIRGRT